MTSDSKATSNENWADQELGSARFRDERLNKRVIQIATDFSNKPTQPINHASEDAAAMKGAYRFFSNRKVESKNILEPHVDNTMKRLSDYPVVLAVQDTTSLNYHNHKTTEGLGEITKIRNTSVKGLHMHSTLAVTSDGLPLGFLDQIIWARQEEKKPKQISDAIEEKESFRWIQSLRNTAILAKETKTKIITVCDREGDIYEFFLEANILEQSVLVRCSHDREINDEEERIWEHMGDLPILGRIKLDIEQTPKRKARKAKLNVRVDKIDLLPPSVSNFVEPITVYAVFVKEIYPPVGEEALEWLLLTTEPIETFKAAEETVSRYKSRWLIEVFHKILKSGLQVEDCLLNHGKKLAKYLTLMSVVGWRLLWMTYLQRFSPSASADTVFTESEWKVIYCIANKKKKPCANPPTLKKAISWLAKMGGFLGRKGDGDPGMITIWRGWSRLIDMVIAYEIFA